MYKTATGLCAGLVTAAFFLPAQASAEGCTFDKEPYDFSAEEVTQLYDCIKDKLAEGYASQGDEIGSTYRTWKPAATRPAAPGPHGDRFLFTFANDIAYEQYVKYQDDGAFSMPVGSVLAKESYKLSKKGEPQRGPLFIMTKVAAGEADEFDNWVYSALQPNGKVMKVKQSFCHDCHAAFEDQDSLGYPAFEVRFGQ